MNRKPRYTYQDAGFNGFLSRSLKSNPIANNVSQGIATGSGKPVNVDLQAMFGALGNIIDLGKLVLDGVEGKIRVREEAGGEDTGWIGNIEL